MLEQKNGVDPLAQAVEYRKNVIRYMCRLWGKDVKVMAQRRDAVEEGSEYVVDFVVTFTTDAHAIIQDCPGGRK